MRTLVEVITKSSERYFFILNFMSEHFDAWEFLIFQSKLKKKDIEIKKKKLLLLAMLLGHLLLENLEKQSTSNQVKCT